MILDDFIIFYMILAWFSRSLGSKSTSTTLEEAYFVVFQGSDS